MEVIATWSSIDLQLTALVSEILGTKFTAVAKMLSVARGARRAVIGAASLAIDDDHRRELFNALLKRVRAVEKHRNKYAHWIWAVSNKRPKDLILVKDEVLALFEAAWSDVRPDLEEWVKKREDPSLSQEEKDELVLFGPTKPRPSLDIKEMYLYTPEEVRGHVIEARQVYQMVQLLALLIRTPDSSPGVRELLVPLSRMLQGLPPLRSR